MLHKFVVVVALLICFNSVRAVHPIPDSPTPLGAPDIYQPQQVDGLQSCLITDVYSLDPCNWAQFRFEELADTDVSTWLHVRFALDGNYTSYSNNTLTLEIYHSETADAWPSVGNYNWRVEADPSSTGQLAEWEWTLHCGWQPGFYTVTVIASEAHEASPVSFRLEVCTDTVPIEELPAFAPTANCEDVYYSESAAAHTIESFRDPWKYDAAERTSAHLSFEVPDLAADASEPLDSQGRRIGLSPGMRVRVENLNDRKWTDRLGEWHVSLRFGEFTDAWFARTGAQEACPYDFYEVTREVTSPNRLFTPDTPGPASPTPAPPADPVPGVVLPPGVVPSPLPVPDYCALNEQMWPENTWSLPLLNLSSTTDMHDAFYGFHVSRVGEVRVTVDGGLNEDGERADIYVRAFRCTAKEGCGAGAALGGCMEQVFDCDTRRGVCTTHDLLRGDYYLQLSLWNNTAVSQGGSVRIERELKTSYGAQLSPLSCGLCPEAVIETFVEREDFVDIYVPRCAAHAGTWYLSVQPPHTWDCREPFDYQFTVRIEIDQLNPRAVLQWDGVNDIEVHDGRIEGFAMPMGTVHHTAYVPTRTGLESLASLADYNAVFEGAVYPLSAPLAPQGLWDSRDGSGPVDRYERAAAWYQIEVPNVLSMAAPTIEVALLGAQWGRRTDSGLWQRLPVQHWEPTGQTSDDGYSGETSWAQFGSTDSQRGFDAEQLRWLGLDTSRFRHASLLIHSSELPIGSLEYDNEELSVATSSTGNPDVERKTDPNLVSPSPCQRAEYECTAYPDRYHEEHDGSTSSCAVVMRPCQVASFLSEERFFVGVAPKRAVWARYDRMLEGQVSVGPDRVINPTYTGASNSKVFGSQNGQTGAWGGQNGAVTDSDEASEATHWHTPISSIGATKRRRSMVDQVYNGDPTAPSAHNVPLEYTLQDLDLRFGLRVRIYDDAPVAGEQLVLAPPASDATQSTQVAEVEHSVRAGEYYRTSIEVSAEDVDTDNRLEIEVFVPYSRRDVTLFVERDGDATALGAGECHSAEWQCTTSATGSASAKTRRGSCTYRVEGCALAAGTYNVAVYGEPVADAPVGVDDERVSFTLVARWSHALHLDQWEVPHNQLVWPSSYNHYSVWLPESNQTVALRVRVGDVENGRVQAYMQFEEVAGEANCFSFGWTCTPSGGAQYCDLVAPYCQRRAGMYYVSVRGVESTWSAGVESRGAPSSGHIGYTITAYRHGAEWVDWMPSMDVNDADSAVRVVRSIPATFDATGIVKFADDIVRPDVRYPFWDPRNQQLRPFATESFGHGALAVLGSEAHYYYFEYSADRSAIENGVSSLHIRLGAAPHEQDAAVATSDRLTLFVAPETIANEMCSCWSCSADAGAHSSYCKVVLEECDLLPTLNGDGSRSTYSGATVEQWYVTVRYDQYDTHASEPIDYVLDLDMRGVADVALESGVPQYGQLGSLEQQHYTFAWPASADETTSLRVEMYIDRDNLDSVEFFMAADQRAGAACPEWAATAPVCEGAQYDEGQGASQYEVCSFTVHPCDIEAGTESFYFSLRVADLLFADSSVEYSIKAWAEQVADLPVDGWPITGAVYSLNHYRLDVSAADVDSPTAPKHLFVQLDGVRGGSVQTWISRGSLGGACSAQANACPADRRPWRNEFEVEIDNCQLAADDVYYVSVAVLEQDDALSPVRYTLRAYTQTLDAVTLPQSAMTRDEASAARISLDRLQQRVYTIDLSAQLAALSEAERAGASLHIRVWNVTWGTMQFWLNGRQSGDDSAGFGKLPSGIGSPACYQERGSVTGNTLIEEPYSARLHEYAMGDMSTAFPSDAYFTGRYDVDRVETFREVPPTERYIRVHCDVGTTDTYYLTLYASLVPEWERLPCDRRINASINVWLETPKAIVPTTSWNFTDSSDRTHWTGPDVPLTIWQATHWQTAWDPNDLEYEPGAQGLGDFVWSRTYSDEWKYFYLPVDLSGPRQYSFVVSSSNHTNTAFENDYNPRNPVLWQGFGYPFDKVDDGSFEMYASFVSSSVLGTEQGALPGIASPTCGTGTRLSSRNCAPGGDSSRGSTCYQFVASGCNVGGTDSSEGYVFIALRYKVRQSSSSRFPDIFPSTATPYIFAQVWPFEDTEGFDPAAVDTQEQFELNDALSDNVFFNLTSDINADRANVGSVEIDFDEQTLGYYPHEVPFGQVVHVAIDVPEYWDELAPYWYPSVSVDYTRDPSEFFSSRLTVIYSVGDEAPTGLSPENFAQDGGVDITVAASSSNCFDALDSCRINLPATTGTTTVASVCARDFGETACCRSELFGESRRIWVSLINSFEVSALFGDRLGQPQSINVSIALTAQPRQLIDPAENDMVLTELTAPYGNTSLTTRTSEMSYFDVYALDVALEPTQEMWIELTVTGGVVDARVDLQLGTWGFGASSAGGVYENVFGECGDGSRWTCVASATDGVGDLFDDRNRCYVQLSSCEVPAGRYYLTVRRDTTSSDFSDDVQYTLDWVVRDVAELPLDASQRFYIGATEADDIYQHFFLPWTNWNYTSEAVQPEPIRSRFESYDRAEIVIEVSDVAWRDQPAGGSLLLGGNPIPTVNCSEIDLYVSSLGPAGENFVPSLGTLALNDDTEETCLTNEPALCTFTDSTEGCPRTCVIRVCDLDDVDLLAQGVWVSVRADNTNNTIGFNVSYSLRNAEPVPDFTLELHNGVPGYPYNNRSWVVDQVNTTTTVNNVTQWQVEDVIEYGPGDVDRYTMWFEVGTDALSTLVHPLSSLWVRLDDVHPVYNGTTELRVWPEHLCEDEVVPARTCRATRHVEEGNYVEYAVNSTGRLARGQAGWTPHACVVQYDPCEFDLSTQRRFFLSVTFDNVSQVVTFASEETRNFTLTAEIREPEKVAVNIDMTAAAASWSIELEQFVEETWHFYHFDFGAVVSPQHHGKLSIRLDTQCSRDDHSVDFAVNTRYYGWREHFATNECNEYREELGFGDASHTFSWEFCEWQAGDVYVGVHSNFNSLMHPNYTVPIRYSLSVWTTPEQPVETIVPSVWHALDTLPISCARDRAQVLVDWRGREWGSQMRVQVRNADGVHGTRHVCSRFSHYTGGVSLGNSAQVVGTSDHVFSGSPLPVTGGVGCDDYSDCVPMSHGAADGDVVTYSANLLEPCQMESQLQYLVLDGLVAGDEVRVLYEPKNIPVLRLDAAAPSTDFGGQQQVSLNQWAFYKLSVSLADRDAAPALWELAVGVDNVEGGDFLELTMLRGDAERPQVPSLGCIDRSLTCQVGDEAPCAMVETLADSWRDNVDAYWLGVVARGSAGANCLTRFDLWASVEADDVDTIGSCDARCVSVDADSAARYVLPLENTAADNWAESLVLFDVRELSGDAPVRISVQQGRLASEEDALATFVIDSADLSGSIDPQRLDALWSGQPSAQAGDVADNLNLIVLPSSGALNSEAFGGSTARRPASGSRRRDAGSAPDASATLIHPEQRESVDSYDAAHFSPFRWSLPCLRADAGDIYVTVESAAAASLVLEFRVERAAPAAELTALAADDEGYAYYTWTPAKLPRGWSILDDLAECERQLAPVAWAHLYKWEYTAENAAAAQPFGWRLSVDRIAHDHATGVEEPTNGQGETASSYARGNLDRAGVLLYVNEGAAPAPWLAGSTSQYPGVAGLNPTLHRNGDRASCSEFPPSASLGVRVPQWEWEHYEQCSLQQRTLYFYVSFPTRQLAYEELDDTDVAESWSATPQGDYVWDDFGSPETESASRPFGQWPEHPSNEHPGNETPSSRRRGAPVEPVDSWVPNEPSTIVPQWADVAARQFKTLPWADLSRNTFVWPYTLSVYVEAPPASVVVGTPLAVNTTECVETFSIVVPAGEQDNQLIVRIAELDGVNDGQLATVHWWREGEDAHCARYAEPVFNNVMEVNAERNCYFARISEPAAGERYFVRVEIDDCESGDCGRLYSYTVDVHFASEYALPWLVPIEWPIPSAAPAALGQQSMGTDETQHVWFRGSVVEGHVYELDLAATSADVQFVAVRLWNVAGGDATLALLSRNLYSVIDLCGADMGAEPKETLSHGNTGACQLVVDRAQLAAMGEPERVLIGVVGKGAQGELDGWSRVEYDLDVTWAWQPLSSNAAPLQRQLNAVDTDFFSVDVGAAPRSLRITVTLISGPAVRVRVRSSQSESTAHWSYREQWCSYGDCTIDVATRAQSTEQAQGDDSSSFVYYVEVQRTYEQRFEKDSLYEIGATIGLDNADSQSLSALFAASEFCAPVAERAAEDFQDDSGSFVWSTDFGSSDLEAQGIYDGLTTADFWQPPPNAACLDALRTLSCLSTFLEVGQDGFVLPVCRTHCDEVVDECGDWVYAAGLPEFDCSNARWVAPGGQCTGRSIPAPPIIITPPPILLPNASNLTEPIIPLTTTSGTTTTSTSTSTSTTSTGTDGPSLPIASASTTTLSIFTLLIATIVAFIF